MQQLTPDGARRIAAVGALAVMSIAAPVAAWQDEAPEAPPRPKFTFLRFNEDWSVLSHTPPPSPADPWDAIKYVPLSDDGNIWASFGGHARLRMESWNNFSFGSTSDDDTFAIWRVALHADVHIGDKVRAFVEGKTADSTDRDLPGGRRALDIDSIALEQAFVDVTIDLDNDMQLILRPGRQALLFGKQRLVSPLPWANTLRRWDGISAILKTRGWTVHGFWTQFVPVQKYEFNTSDRQTQLFGVYATGKLEGGPGLDLYFLGYDKQDPVTFNGTTGEEERYTFGGRVFHKFAETGIDFDVEGAYQFGEVGSGDVSAFMVGSQLGWAPSDAAWKPRVFVGFDYGSGDDSPGGDVETFNQLFPLGHAYFGHADVIGRQNAVDLNAGVTAAPTEKMKLRLAGHFFWRDDTSDALYNAGGGVVRAGALGSDSEIGQEIDVTMTYRFDSHMVGQVGYSHFFTGDFIDESGASDDLDFFYAQLQYTF